MLKRSPHPYPFYSLRWDGEEQRSRLQFPLATPNRSPLLSLVVKGTQNAFWNSALMRGGFGGGDTATEAEGSVELEAEELQHL